MLDSSSMVMSTPDILQTIIQRKRQDIQESMSLRPLASLRKEVESLETPTVVRSLSRSLASSPTGIIAEFKRKSPSLGWIKEEARPADIVPAYAANGASALSILTDAPFFGGSPEYIREVRNKVSLPILRKDFIIDDYQVYETRLIGADAMLLIAACLDLPTCRHLASLAHSLGIEVLLEVHETTELDYICDGVTCVGVNNRNLHTFVTDIQTSVHLADAIPSCYVKVSESGIHDAASLHLLQKCGYQGFLMGERFMKCPSPADALAQFLKSI